MVLTSCFSGACGSAVLSLARTVTGSDPEITYIGTETLHTKQYDVRLLFMTIHGKIPYRCQHKI